MIKPFTIIKTVVEPEGNIGVHFEVTKANVTETGASGTLTLTAYMSVDPTADLEEEVFKALDGEWI